MFSPEIKEMMGNHNKAKSKCWLYPTEYNIASYKKLLNICNRMCRDAKCRNIHTLIEKLPSEVFLLRYVYWTFLMSLGVGKSKENQNFSIKLNDLNA